MTETHSAQETQNIASDFAKKLKGGECIALQGSLGAGKTTFVQGMALGLKIDPRYYVNSPTFTLINEYKGTKRLVHMDLYRLHSYAEVLDLGYEDLLGSDSLLVVEWADKFSEMQTIFQYQINLEIVGEDDRKIEIN